MIIRQGKEEKFLPTLYVMPVNRGDLPDAVMQTAIKKLSVTYPGLSAEQYKTGFKINIPDSYKVGHEAHFGQVMERYLSYLKQGSLPAWEIPNMLAKYYVTTQSVKVATTNEGK